MNLNTHFVLYAVRNSAKTVLIVCHQLLFLIPFYVWKPEYLSYTILLLPFVLFIFLINSFLVNIIVGFLSVQYRDFQNIVTNLTLLAFLVTPIFWPVNLTGRAFFIDLNPIFHFVQLMRQPMLGLLPDISNVAGVIISTIVLSSLAFYFSVSKGKKLFFYL